jgi:hypothetical protein
MGGALGLATLSTVAITAADDGLGVSAQSDGAVEGFQAAFVVAGFAVVGAVVALSTFAGRAAGTLPVAKPSTEHR